MVLVIANQAYSVKTVQSAVVKTVQVAQVLANVQPVRMVSLQTAVNANALASWRMEFASLVTRAHFTLSTRFV